MSAGSSTTRPNRKLRFAVVATVASLLLLACASLAALLPNGDSPTGASPASGAAQTSGEPATSVGSEHEVDAAESDARLALIPATVVRVVDGDTAVFRLPGGLEEKTRFIGVNTPESTIEKEPYGKEASTYTKSVLTRGRKVYLEKDVEERDKYGRLLAYVWLQKPGALSEREIRSKMFDARLALDGYAQQMTIPPNVKYAEYFRVFVSEARQSEKGLWGLSEPGGKVPVGGKQTSGTAKGKFVGSSRRNKYHYPDCKWAKKIDPGNVVWFASSADALAKGYVPCKVCDPPR